MIKITPKTITRHELIGLKCVVVRASNPEIVGTKGTVVDETKNMIVIENSERRMVPKKDAIFQFELEETVRVNGRRLLGRPEDRVSLRR
ncbi:MAG: ribonuclease P protein component 1 [Candidatus Hydrothermarchaeaceae archaeon]